MMKPLPLAVAYLALVTLPLAAGTDRWTPAGPDGGRVTGLAVDAQGVWYAADEFSSVHRSMDGGASWARLAGTHPGSLHRLEVSGRRLWAAGGRAAAGAPVSTSPDGGRTWRAVSPPSFAGFGRLVRALAVPPGAPTWAYVAHDEIFAAGGNRGAVDRTTDGGATWRTVLSGVSPSAVAVAPTDHQVVYVGVDSFADRDSWLLVTQNGGRTWHQRRPPAELTSPEGFAPPIEAVVVEPGNSRWILVLTSSAVARSRDGGTTWTVRPLPGEAGPASGLSLDPRDAQRWLVWGSSGGICYGGSVQADNYFDSVRGWSVVTSDGGATWGDVVPLDEVHHVRWDPRRPGRALAAVSRLGVVASPDGGASWRVSHRGLRAAVVCALTSEPHPGGGVVAGLGLCSGEGGVTSGDDGGYLRFQGGAWIRLNRNLRDPTRLFSAIGAVVDPTTPGVLYALTGYRLARSRDGGTSWSSLHDLAADGVILNNLVLDPENPRRLLAGGWKPEGFRQFSASKLLQSDDEGATWVQVPIPRLDQARGVFRRLNMVWQQGGSSPSNFGRRIAFDPLIEGRLLAFWPGSAGVQRSTDDGVTWHQVHRGLPQNFQVAQVVFDPRRPGLAYLLDRSGALFVSEDAGEAWRRLEVEGLRGLAGVVALTLAVDAEHPETLYAGTSGGGGFFVLTRSER